MHLTEENHQQIINSYTNERWQPLFELIPELETIIQFSDAGFRDRAEFDAKVFAVQIRFQNVIEEIPITFSFNWPAWEEGRRIAGNPRFDFNSIDIPAKCKILIALNRSEHFCSGALAGNIRSGLILRILKSIRDQVK